MREPQVEPIAELNANYDPPQPWKCMTFAEHDCNGLVIGKVGSYPVCSNGATAEIAERKANAERIAALHRDPDFQRLLAEEHAIEVRFQL